ncbi:1,4-dihydroxy-2-naphthoate polyprenyltransferase [Streptomyces griseocarneus]|nr:1,4-dihydroxy-2-naphthoate polyprenyltransferase [Streptomyces griseocarneus]
MPATWAPLVTGLAIAHSLGSIDWWRAVLTVLFLLGFVIGTNFCNDYSDGVRGTDSNRVGPVRLVGSGQVSPRQVLRVGMVCYAVMAAAGLILAATVSWWMIAVTVFCGLGGWYYTGGSKPYGYRGLGEVSVFIHHGLIFVCATAGVQLGHVPWLALAASVPAGLLCCALLVTNNLRDIETDAAAGKITLAVRLGEPRTRALYTGIVGVAFASALALAPDRPWTLLVLAALPFAVAPLRRVLSGARGTDLIAALEGTCLLIFAFGTLFAIGLAV